MNIFSQKVMHRDFSHLEVAYKNQSEGFTADSASARAMKTRTREKRILCLTFKEGGPSNERKCNWSFPMATRCLGRTQSSQLWIWWTQPHYRILWVQHLYKRIWLPKVAITSQVKMAWETSGNGNFDLNDKNIYKGLLPFTLMTSITGIPTNE